MITLSIDETKPEVLRISASYLLALAGDITCEVHVTQRDAPAVFNAGELAEAATLTPAEPVPPMTAAQAFGGAPVPPAVPAPAPSTVGAVPLPTAPGAMPVTTSTETSNAPVPPVPNSANVAAPVAPQTPAPAPGVEVDARGLPWDARIHSRTKTKLANGNWKNARGVEAATLTAVENELRLLMAIPAGAPVAAPSPIVNPVPTPPVVSPPLAPVATAPAPVPTPPVAPAPVSTASTASPSSPAPAAITDPFPALMQKIVQATTARQLNQAQVNTILAQSGLQALPQLLSRPDLIPTVEQGVDAQIAHNVATGQPV